MSQRLAHELGRFEPQLLTQLVTIIQHEREVQDEEATVLVELLRRDLDRWDARPAMSDYCGLQDRESVFLMHEVKNRDGRCRNHREGPRPNFSCTTCRHRVGGEGPENDRRVMAEMKELAINAVPAGMSPNTQDMSNHLQLVGAIKSFEAAQAYYTGTFSLTPPKYLASCSFASTQAEWVACIVRNPDDLCADWQSADESQNRQTQNDRIGYVDSAKAQQLIERLKGL